MRLRTKYKKLLFRWSEDPVYNSFWINKFVGLMVKNGKKASIENILGRMFTQMKLYLRGSPYNTFIKVLKHIKPVVWTLSVRWKTRSDQYLIPRPLAFMNQYIQAMRYLTTKTTGGKKLHIDLNSYLLTEVLGLLSGRNLNIYKEQENLLQLILRTKIYLHQRWK